MLEAMAGLTRLTWLYTQCPLFFITTCAHNRRRILARADVHESFVQFGLAGPKYGVWIGRYVIMPDHLHVFAGFGPESISLPKWEKSLKNAISKVLRTANFSAPHFQKGFFDHVIRSEESYSEKWEYVRQNPVRAGLVARLEGWPYAGELFELGKDARS